MTKTTTCVYHFLVLNWYIFLNYHIPQIGRNEEKLREFHDGGRSKYLTLLNLLLQAIFFGVACLDDVLKRVIGRKDIKFVTSFRDLLFTTMAFPISTFYPKGLDDFFPAWVNHAMHTSIFPFSLFETILRPHNYPSKKLGLTLLGAFNFAYIIRILWRYVQTGNWVYPVFDSLSPLGIIIFFSAAYILVAGIYLFGEKINHWKWGAIAKPQMKKN